MQRFSAQKFVRANGGEHREGPRHAFDSRIFEEDLEVSDTMIPGTVVYSLTQFVTARVFTLHSPPTYSYSADSR